LDSSIAANIIWQADEGRTGANDVLAAVVARILRPEVFEARASAEELLALAKKLLPSSDPKPDSKQSSQRIKELEAELALLRSAFDAGSDG
jgi:hypothetical protein